jgi:RimJ/RimL family protein N-acetyltransferase
MDVLARFERAERDADFAAMRTRHLDTLGESQEAFLEVMAAGAQLVRIVVDDVWAGYALVTEDAALVEYHLDPPWWVFGETILWQLVQAHGLSRALVQSFDSLLFSSVVDRCHAIRSVGLLCRDYLRRPLPVDAEGALTRTLARDEDLPRVLAVDQDVFTHEARLRAVISRGYLSLFTQADRVVGFGIVRPVIPGRPEVDIGIAIDRAERKRGYSEPMLQQLMDHAVAEGLRPVAGCTRENVISRSMGERVGFVARHRLLEARFDRGEEGKSHEPRA